MTVNKQNDTVSTKNCISFSCISNCFTFSWGSYVYLQMRTLIFIFSTLFYLNLYSQIQTPKTPTFNGATTVSPNGNHASNIIQQQNRAAMKAMGYSPPPTQKDIQARIEAERQANYSQQRVTNQRMATYLQLKNEWTTNYNPTIPANRIPNPVSPEFIQAEQHYKNALNDIVDQLEGKKEIDYIKAIHAVENAYYNNTLPYDYFYNEFKKSAEVVQQYVREQGKNPNNKFDLQWGILDYLSDTITITNIINETKTIHYPQQYDFDDPFGNKDYANRLVTKLNQTNVGQCQTMPMRGKAIAEILGVQFHIANAPNHNFIMYNDEEGNTFNFETTQGLSVTDVAVMRGTKINTKALHSKAYMQPLTMRQSIAESLLNLTDGYEAKFKTIGDGKFILKCVDIALKEFPNGENNIRAHLIRYNTYIQLFDQLANKYKTNSKEELIKNYPEAKILNDKIVATDNKLTELGFTEWTKTEYDSWLQELADEKEKRGDNLIFRSLEISR